MNFKKKILIKKHNTHRRLWLSSIITLFIFATSVSAYFLVKNSQDIRRSAADPYLSLIPTPTIVDCVDNGGACFYSGSCADDNRLPMDGYCSYPGFCCGPVSETPLCTPGDRACISDSQLSICKADGSGYIITACASGTSCDSAQKACIADPTPDPSVTCSINGGQCLTVNSCSDVYMQTIAGTCSDSKKCCKTIEQFACNAGEMECVNTTTRRYCNSERTAWITASCPSGSTCQDGTCIFPCQGTCYSNSSCSAIGKYSAVGECSSSGSVCCKEPDSSTPIEVEGVNCEGSCYKSSSCSSINKASADGECATGLAIFTTDLVCCKEPNLNVQAVASQGGSCAGSCYEAERCSDIGKTNAYTLDGGSYGSCGSNNLVCCTDIFNSSGKKVIGALCSSSSECASGYCYDSSGMINYQAANYNYLTNSSSPRCQEYSAEYISEIVLKGNLIGVATGVSVVAAPFAISALGTALTTAQIAAYSTVTAALTTSPVWMQKAVNTGTLVTQWYALVKASADCLTGSPDACLGLQTAWSIDPDDFINLANNTDNLFKNSYQSIKKMFNLDDALDVDVRFGPSQSNIQETTDYFYPKNPVIQGAYDPDISSFKKLGAGFFGDTYLDSINNYAVKVFAAPTDLNNVYQRQLYEQFSDQAPFITYRGTLPGEVGFAQDYFPNTVSAKSYIGPDLTDFEINQALNDLATMQNVTGVPHGDLHMGNTLIQTLPSGERRVVIIDYGGTQLWNDQNLAKQMQDEFIKFEQSLRSLNYPQAKLFIPSARTLIPNSAMPMSGSTTQIPSFTTNTAP
jgi:hypothetical protein